MTRVPPSIKPAPQKPTQRPQTQSPSAPARPRTTKTSQQSPAQKAQERRADEEVPELKEGPGQAGEGQGGPEWTLTGEFVAVNFDEHQNREERLDHHQRAKEDEREKDNKVKAHEALRTVHKKSSGQQSGQQAKTAGSHVKGDGFGETHFESTPTRLHQLQKLQQAQHVQRAQASTPTTGPRMGGGNLGDALKALHNAKDHGVFFKERESGQGRPDEEMEDPELEAAVEECIRLLFGVHGILRVGPGENEAGEKVVLISAARGFTAQSMAAVPQSVHRFKTLLALPFELLPLRRERP